MSKSLLLVCAVAGNVWGSGYTEDFYGLSATETKLVPSPNYATSNRWCGGHNFIKELKFGKGSAKYSEPYAFFTALAMRCYYDDHGEGGISGANDVRMIFKMNSFKEYHSEILDCSAPSYYVTDGINRLIMYAHDENGGFGRVRSLCASRKRDHTYVETLNTKWASKGSNPYYLSCPRNEILIGMNAAFSTKGFIACKAWCGSVTYFLFMPKLDTTLDPSLRVIGHFVPGSKFSIYLKKTAQDAIMCPHSTFMSGWRIVTAIEANIYNIVVFCGDGSRRAGSRLIPEGKTAISSEYTCKDSTAARGLRYLPTYNKSWKWGIPGVDLYCSNGAKLEHHNSTYTPGFDTDSEWVTVNCTDDKVAAGLFLFYETRYAGTGVREIELICKDP